VDFSRFYTVDEVNRMLPELRKQLEQLQAVKMEHLLKREELQELKLAMYKSTATNPEISNDPFFAIECELDFLEWQAKQIVTSFTERDIMIKSIDAGLVDFPAIIDGEVVLLCWLKDEPCVKHFHGLNDGFWGRRKLEGETE
jgi:hypothetical protein